MITVIIRRSAEPTVIQMTQADLARQLSGINGAEVLLEDTWRQGLKKVRTPYFALVEPDCVFSANYFSSNVGLIAKAHAKVVGSTHQPMGGGGYQKLAMLSSCLGVHDFENRIYAYELGLVKEGELNSVRMKGWHIVPARRRLNMRLYHVQVGFVPGAIIRTSAIKDIIEDKFWDEPDMVQLSTALSFYLWDTRRRIQVNPNTTYVSADDKLEQPPLFKTKVPDKVANIFHKEGIGWNS